ncbi:hypothetical protein BOX15_Mlig003764g1 [Macrostomum lignano]|uniref:Rapamycin-insensitive companion of mTOR domain-containing protein n=1 Tax=Macrostomum lignano TaxID=282301 RepID=A0A267E450_9PLAT|nr:hypothetical protein BOX15_Mlig003764g1 [Macrostomum lignano]
MDDIRNMQRRTHRRRADFSSAGISPGDDPKELLRKVSETFLSRSAQPASTVRKVHVCNALVRMTKRIKANVSSDDLFCSLLPAFFQDCREVRAAGLRCIRKFLTDQSAVNSFYKFHFDLCVAKCLDLGCLDEEASLAPLFQSERFQAVKMIRQLTTSGGGRVPASLVQPLLSICRYADREERRDQLMKTALYLLAELGALNPSQLAGSGALKTVLQAVLDTSLPPRCTEALVGVLAHLLNRPDTRRYLRPLPESLHCLLSPLTNPTSCRGGDGRQAVLCLFRTWPGLLSLSPRSLVAMLFVNSEEARSALVDFFFDLFLVPKPAAGVTEFNEAIRCLDPSDDAWDLTDGFVAAEGSDLLDYRCPTRLNLLDNHLAFLLHLFVQCGLAHGLSSLLADKSSDQLGIRCALLLGELTHRSRLLPAALRSISAALSAPALLRNQRALHWLAAVQRAREKPPPPKNVLLAALVSQTKPVNTSLLASASAAALASACASLAACPDDPDDWAWPEMLGLVRCCLQVDVSTDGGSGAGSTISLAAPVAAASPTALSDWLAAARRLCAFYSPPTTGATAASFVTMPLSWRHAADAYLTGIELIQLMAKLPDSNELHKCVISLVANLSAYVRNRLMSAPSLLVNTCARYAPGLIGALTASERGEEALEACNAKQLLLDLVSDQAHSYFPKLVLASIDYTRNGGFGRLLLSKALSSGDEDCRLYATRFTTVLLRADMPFFANWGIELLVKQLYDTDPTVCQTALAVLEEACELEVNKNILVRLRPAAVHLGDQGAVFIAKLCGFSLGFRVLQESNWFQQHFDLWCDRLCNSYPMLVEQTLTEALTGYEIPPPGQDFVRASSRPKSAPRRVLLPTHLFGQLALHKEGFDFLRNQSCVRKSIDLVYQLLQPGQRFDTEAEIIAAKAAVWSLGHIGSTSWGLPLLEQERVAPALAMLAEQCPVLSVRGACFWSLCLVAATERGCDLLADLGWEALRSNRSQLYPVVLPRPDQLLLPASVSPPTTESVADSWRLSQDSVIANGSRTSSVGTADGILGRPHSLSAASGGQYHLHVSSVKQQHQTRIHQSSDLVRKTRSISASECDGVSIKIVSSGEHSDGLSADAPSAVVVAAAAAAVTAGSTAANQQLALPSSVSTWTGGTVRALQQQRVALTLAANSPSLSALDSAAVGSSTLSLTGGLRGCGGHKSAAALTKRCGATAGVLYQCLALPIDPIRVTLCDCGCDNELPAAATSEASDQSLSTPTNNNTNGDAAGVASASAASDGTSGYASRSDSKPHLNDTYGCNGRSGSVADVDSTNGSSGSGLELHTEESCIACSLLAYRGLPVPPAMELLADSAASVAWIRRETVRLVGQLACHVNQSRNESALIQLKARRPAAFSQDLCLYSEVALVLAKHPYSRRSRAFVQDLFADSAFDILYSIPTAN